MQSDASIVYYTANEVSDSFIKSTQEQLLKASGGLPIYSVSLNKEIDFGTVQLTVRATRSHCNIYRQALRGAKMAESKWIFLCEDDMLYSSAHFNYRPKKTPFAYNLGYWNIYTWQDPPIYNYKGRKNLGNLICEREAFIEAMEERFAKWPDESKVDTNIWAEPGKYERQLGVTIRETEDFYTHPPNIKFSHETELSFAGLGTRKRAGDIRADSIPYWGKAEDIRKLYQ